MFNHSFHQGARMVRVGLHFLRSPSMYVLKTALSKARISTISSGQYQCQGFHHTIGPFRRCKAQFLLEHHDSSRHERACKAQPGPDTNCPRTKIGAHEPNVRGPPTTTSGKGQLPLLLTITASLHLPIFSAEREIASVKGQVFLPCALVALV